MLDLKSYNYIKIAFFKNIKSSHPHQKTMNFNQIHRFLLLFIITYKYWHNYTLPIFHYSIHFQNYVTLPIIFSFVLGICSEHLLGKIIAVSLLKSSTTSIQFSLFVLGNFFINRIDITLIKSSFFIF